MTFINFTIIMHNVFIIFYLYKVAIYYRLRNYIVIQTNSRTRIYHFSLFESMFLCTYASLIGIFFRYEIRFNLWLDIRH